MSREDWYRNKVWDEETKTLFLQRLSRKRSGNDQYLVIQAQYLESTAPNAAIELLDLYEKTKRSTFNDGNSHLVRAHAHLTLGSIDCAIEAYKCVLAFEVTHPNQKTNAQLELPYLIAEHRVTGEYVAAWEILHQTTPNFPIYFPSQHFLKNAALAIIGDHRGIVDRARAHAVVALEHALTRFSRYENHPNLGLVSSAHETMVRRLEVIALA